MKTIFITHTTGYGGAAISLTTNLRYLIESGKLSAKDCIIAVPANERDLSASAYHWFEYRVPFGYWQMPFSTAYKGGSKKISSKLYSIVKEAISILCFVGVYNRAMKRDKITHIHLNSMVFWSLLPFLPKRIKKIIHIREMITDDFSGWIARKVINRYADTIIGITYQTTKGLLDNTIIIENPFDMYRARQFRNVRQELKTRLRLPEDSFVVSVFAPIGKQKGTEFLLEVIKHIPKESPIHFVLVGEPFRGEDELYRNLKEIPTVHIFPTSHEMDRYYAITDIVLRCEEYLPLGRTVYEGIYAGCMALLPFAEEDELDELEKYIDQIHLYPAGDAKLCAKGIMAIYHAHKNGIIDNGFAPTSNVPESAEKLLTVLT